MNSKAYQQIFPNVRFRKGSQAADRLQTEEGGLIAFVGRGGSITGRGADLMIIDDPLKNRAEADSDVTRNDLWKWFNDDVMSRMMRSEEHTSELQSLMRISYAVCCLKKKKTTNSAEENKQKEL